MEDANWALQEFAAADLGDARRTERLRQLATALAQRPSASLPAACQDEAELDAAYRFFANDHITPGTILYSHIDATIERANLQTRVLAVQDTVYFNFSHHPATAGLGPIAGPKQQGFIAHCTLIFTPQRLPLGILQQQTWTRDPDYSTKREQRNELPIEEKESFKWLRSLAAVNEAAAECPTTQFISVGDAEADVYDLFIAARASNTDLLVRAAQDRKTNDEVGHLWRSLAASSDDCVVVVDVPRKGDQAARQATVRVRWRAVELCPPAKRSKEKLPKVRLWSVLAKEEQPPAGVEPLEWLLLTTVAVENEAAALERLGWYGCRWGIEVWHKVLKSGCDFEARQLGSVERLERALALYSVIAWRILYTTMLARTMPNISCEAVLERAEWEALWCHIHQVATAPATPPSLGEAVRMIAQLGGFLGRKGDGEPGVVVMWRGFQRLHGLAAMYRLMRPKPPLRNVRKD